MIYTDGNHIATDGDIEDLHKFAESINLDQEFFKDQGFPHYIVLNRSIFEYAISKGAIYVGTPELMRKCYYDRGSEDEVS
jgi:hypothetical protein